MGDVVSLRPAERHRSGLAICRGCRHEWEALTEGDGIDLECPECSSMKGTFKWPYGPAEGQISWSCLCGCEDFFIMKSKPDSVGGVFCRNCGDETTGWFE